MQVSLRCASVPFELTDSFGAVIDCSSATFSARLVTQAGAVVLTKTTGIVGAATSPNAVVAWAAGELATVAPGSYYLELSWTIGGNDQSIRATDRPVVVGASVWSADPSTFGEYPAQSLLSFLSNHGLLGVGRRPQWRTIVGGSRTYVGAIAQRLTGEVRLSAQVLSISRTLDGRVEVTTTTGTDTFDKAILAVHSDQALAMIADPSAAEKELLGDIRYHLNRATLHTDTSCSPTVTARGQPGTTTVAGPIVTRPHSPMT